MTTTTTTTTTNEVAVSEGATIARCNRALVKDGRRLRKCPPRSRSFGTLGPYWMESTFDGNVDGSVYWPRTLAELDALARELGVMHTGERIAEGA